VTRSLAATYLRQALLADPGVRTVGRITVSAQSRGLLRLEAEVRLADGGTVSVVAQAGVAQ
jgi:hypothetical protein